MLHRSTYVCSRANVLIGGRIVCTWYWITPWEKMFRWVTILIFIQDHVVLYRSAFDLDTEPSHESFALIGVYATEAQRAKDRAAARQGLLPSQIHLKRTTIYPAACC